MLCWPISDPLARYRMVREKGNARLVEAHDAYWASEAEMEEGNPQLILERGEAATPLPPAIVVQGTGRRQRDPRHGRPLRGGLRARGGQLELHKFAGQPHTFILRDPASEASRRATEKLRDFVLRQAGTGIVQALIAHGERERGGSPRRFLSTGVAAWFTPREREQGRALASGSRRLPSLMTSAIGRGRAARDVGERVAVDHHEVGELALLDRAELVLPAQALGGPAGRGLQRLHRRHPGPHEAFEFDGIGRVAVAAGVGAGNDLDADASARLMLAT